MALTHDDLKLLQDLFEKNNQTLKEGIQEEMQELHQVLRNDVAQFKDDILTEIVKLRDDSTVVTGYKDQLEDHESRLETIETKLDIAI